MKKIIIIFMLAIIIYDSCIATPKTIFESTESDKKTSIMPPIKTTYFINGRVNDIIIRVIYGKNQPLEKIIAIGHTFTYHHKPNDLKKVTCSNIIQNEKPVTITESDLKNHAVFVFNTDKIEKYHFKDAKHKEIALKHADHNHNEKFYKEIEELTMYNP
ncbi:hypothetical protein KBC04_00595 [Candidatus Babeliales bacterium]|nr:hypothetical protein [Candidatus Babeliales bacterium]MBP9843410.1 hypothetical protein [Candidatus Babeliales bacterium]